MLDGAYSDPSTEPQSDKALNEVQVLKKLGREVSEVRLYALSIILNL